MLFPLLTGPELVVICAQRRYCCHQPYFVILRSTNTSVQALKLLTPLNVTFKGRIFTHCISQHSVPTSCRASADNKKMATFMGW